MLHFVTCASIAILSHFVTEFSKCHKMSQIFGQWNFITESHHVTGNPFSARGAVNWCRNRKVDLKDHNGGVIWRRWDHSPLYFLLDINYLLCIHVSWFTNHLTHWWVRHMQVGWKIYKHLLNYFLNDSKPTGVRNVNVDFAYAIGFWWLLYWASLLP